MGKMLRQWAASQSETRNTDNRHSRGRAPDSTTQPTPAEPAPDVADEASLWYNTDGNAATKLNREFRKRVFEQQQGRASCHVRSQPR
jgi:hypothetical protein